MEFKVILYIIIGVVYFVYTIIKKGKENQEEAADPGEKKTVSPPAASPLDEITRELKRRQAEIDAKKRQQRSKPQPKPLVAPRPAVKKQEVLVREKQTAYAGEGNSSEPVYERELTEEEKIVRGDIRLVNEGIYKTESMEEMEAREKTEETTDTYIFDARQAFIGSLIFERKF